MFRIAAAEPIKHRVLLQDKSAVFNALFQQVFGLLGISGVLVLFPCISPANALPAGEDSSFISQSI